jgi:hypothetical protein
VRRKLRSSPMYTSSSSRVGLIDFITATHRCNHYSQHEANTHDNHKTYDHLAMRQRKQPLAASSLHARPAQRPALAPHAAYTCPGFRENQPQFVVLHCQHFFGTWIKPYVGLRQHCSLSSCGQDAHFCAPFKSPCASKKRARRSMMDLWWKAGFEKDRLSTTRMDTRSVTIAKLSRAVQRPHDLSIPCQVCTQYFVT